MPIDYLKRILNSRVYDVVQTTPLEAAPGLSASCDNRVWLKREDYLPVFSFKLRGAYNKLAGLSVEKRERGVVCASAGNHAQGVAFSADFLKSKATIVMPKTTPRIKVDAVKKLGGKAVKTELVGSTFDEAYEYARGLEKHHELTFVHPFDDPDIIAGQGTIGMEILHQYSRYMAPGGIHAVFCPIGGGGLISGVAAYIKSLRPEIKIIGVEAIDSDAMTRSLRAGRRVKLQQIGLFADGTAVKQVGGETFRLCRQFVDETICVDTDAICAAIKEIFEDTRSVMEPAGALAVAGLRAYVQKYGVQGENMVAITSGANMNFNRLRFVAERAEVGERREALFAVTLPERPGAYKAFVSLIGKRDITEFNYRYSDAHQAHVFVGMEVEGSSEAKALLDMLHREGYESIDLSGDEMAKLHIRHLVGGHAPQAENEILYRLEFPERPGALMNFLNHMSADWNISLFHYRNHGADTGRVLVGMQVPPEDQDKFKVFLQKLGYQHWNESDNPAYKLFLS